MLNVVEVNASPITITDLQLSLLSLLSLLHLQLPDEALLTDGGALDGLGPVRQYPDSGPGGLLQVLQGLLQGGRPHHHLPPLAGTDGPVSQVAHTDEAGAGLSQGGHGHESQGDDQHALLAGGKGDDQSPQLRQRVDTEDLTDAGVSDVGVAGRVDGDGLQGGGLAEDGVQGGHSTAGSLQPRRGGHTGGRPGQVRDCQVGDEKQVKLP